jgi:hypothetical protein
VINTSTIKPQLIVQKFGTLNNNGNEMYTNPSDFQYAQQQQDQEGLFVFGS